MMETYKCVKEKFKILLEMSKDFCNPPMYN